MAVRYNVDVPKYLNSPLQILWWEIDVWAVILGCFFCAMYFGGLGFWVAQFALPWIYIEGKKLGNRGYLKHLMIKTGLASLKGYPTAFEQKFME